MVLVVLGEQQKPEMHLARFGLIPHWAKDGQTAMQIGRKTYNARTETVAEKPSYRTAWRKRQLAIVTSKSPRNLPADCLPSSFLVLAQK